MFRIKKNKKNIVIQNLVEKFICEDKIVYFITVKKRWKYKKGNFITFDSIFFLCVGWVKKGKRYY